MLCNTHGFLSPPTLCDTHEQIFAFQLKALKKQPMMVIEIEFGDRASLRTSLLVQRARSWAAKKGSRSDSSDGESHGWRGTSDVSVTTTAQRFLPDVRAWWTGHRPTSARSPPSQTTSGELERGGITTAAPPGTRSRRAAERKSEVERHGLMQESG